MICFRSIVKHFLNFLSNDVLKNLKPPKIQQKVVQVLTDQEIGRLLAAFCAHHLSTKQVCLHWTANID